MNLKATGGISISIHSQYNRMNESYNGYEECSCFLYGDIGLMMSQYQTIFDMLNFMKDTKLPICSNVDVFAFDFLEQSAWRFYQELLQYSEKNEIVVKKSNPLYNVQSLESREKHIFNLIDKIAENIKNIDPPMEDYVYNEISIIKIMYESLKAFNKDVVKKDGSGIFASYDKCMVMKDFMKSMDRCQNLYSIYSIGEIIKIKYMGLSSGESSMINLIASLYTSIKNLPIEKENCVLLFDEPDVNMHPEWSRLFIQKMQDLLSSKLFNKRKFQLLITTHSPIMLSDIPIERIHCLETVLNDETNSIEVRIKDNEYGFMSNINEIMRNDFFTELLFGEFSVNYVKSILNDIKNIDVASDEKVIKAIRFKINIIREPIIRKQLELKLKIAQGMWI